jgi:DNA primase
MSLKFRNVEPGARPKYGQHSGQKPRLYNAAAYFTAANIIGVSEGEIDAIAATEHLGVPTLGCPGATNWQEYWGPLFKDFTRVFIFADGDEPGRDFALAVSERIGWRARIVQCPDDEDVASLAAGNRLDSITTSIREEEE